MSRKNNIYKKFATELRTLRANTSRNSWQAISFASVEPAVAFWDSLSNRQKIALVKDSKWNHYPKASWSHHSKRKYGSVVAHLVQRAIESSEGDLSILQKHSVGVFAIHTIDKAAASVRIKMAKRLKASKDVRLRTRSVRILPIQNVPFFLNDKAYTVRNHAIKRIGLDNCYKAFLPNEESPQQGSGRWWFRWLEGTAIQLAKQDELTHLIPILAEDNPESSLSRLALEALLKRIPREDIIFYLQNTELSSEAETIISRKLK